MDGQVAIALRATGGGADDRVIGLACGPDIGFNALLLNQVNELVDAACGLLLDCTPGDLLRYEYSPGDLAGDDPE